MAETTFGERLAEARRIKGETIEEVSDQLRIRPSIILAMETSNFSHMPHKGYARNMVSSYARYIGLDSTRITEQFLREFRRWESKSKHGGNSNSNSLLLASQRYPDLNEPEPSLEKKSGNRETITAAGRNRDRSSVWGKDNKRETNKEFREQLRQVQDDKGYRQAVAVRRPPARKGTDADATPSRQMRPNDYVGKPPKKSLFSNTSSSLSSRPLLLVVGLVIAFVAILILWAFLASTCANNEAANTPVTGVSSSDEGLDESQASNSVADIEAQITEDNRYGPFELKVEVSEGASWLQIDVDGLTPVGEIITGPWTGTYTVSSTSRIEAGAPGYVKVYRNGVEVALETADGLGTLELKVEQRPIAQNAQNADAESQT